MISLLVVNPFSWPGPNGLRAVHLTINGPARLPGGQGCYHQEADQWEEKPVGFYRRLIREGEKNC